MIFAAANGWEFLIALVAATPGIIAAAVLLRAAPKITAIDNAVNNRGKGATTISEDVAVSRQRDEAADAD